MKRFIICITLCTLGCITAFAQNEGHIKTDLSDSKKILHGMPANSKIETSDSLLFDHKFPYALSNKALFTSPIIYNASLQNYDLSELYMFNDFNLLTYNQRMLQIGLGEINNIGSTLIWQSTGKIALEGSAFISQQYGYMPGLKHTSFGLRMNVDYQFNNQLTMALWRQYIINQTKNIFIRSINGHPKTGVGVRLENAPTINTKYSIDAGYEENIFDGKTFDYKVEGKVKIGF